MQHMFSFYKSYRCAKYLHPWSLYNPIDPANHLERLAEELLEIGFNQDKVRIIGHVPPIENALKLGSLIL